MYAIVKTGGKQYRVERGQTLLVERLPAEAGASVALEPVLYRSEEAVFDAASLKKVDVTAKVIGHERGEKLRVFKFKPKRGYKRRTGHRQELTRIEVTDISIGAPAAKAAPKAKSEPAAAKPAAARGGAAKPAAAKPAAASGAGAAKASAKKPAAARKPAAEESAPKSPKSESPAGADDGGEA
jgi:large subunit ribosomal protein L21